MVHMLPSPLCLDECHPVLKIGKEKRGYAILHTTQFLTGSVCTVASAMEFVHTKMCSKKLTPASCAYCPSAIPAWFRYRASALGRIPWVRDKVANITSGLPTLGCGLNVGIKARPLMCHCTPVGTRTSHLWGLRPQVGTRTGHL